MLIIDFIYLLAAVLFIFGIKQLTRVKTARKGNMLAAFAMFLAVLATLLKMHFETGRIGWGYIIAGIVIGGAIGAFLSIRVKMTEMPQLVAMFNGFGGGASVLVALAYFWVNMVSGIVLDTFDITTVVLSVIIGTVTFTGSMVAFGKLHGLVRSRPILFKGNNLLNLLLFISVAGLGIYIFLIKANSGSAALSFLILIGIAAVLGVLLVTPIGGADMPVVISLLNSYSGIAAAATGFVLKNNLLIISGALVGASGLILTGIMCKAMNRSLVNVLFGGFGAKPKEGKEDSEYKNITELSPEEAALILENADSVVFVPGYGLAVAHAQYAVQELAELLEKQGKKTFYAVHPVAGRMPGHMNVLLAEANVSYEKIFDIEKANPEFRNIDVVFVIGANDVVNPAAATDKGSPIYGMPILKAHEARTVVVVKRSLSPGFSGIKNELFEKDNTQMLFGDAKEVFVELKREMEEV